MAVRNWLVVAGIVRAEAFKSSTGEIPQPDITAIRLRAEKRALPSQSQSTQDRLTKERVGRVIAMIGGKLALLSSKRTPEPGIGRNLPVPMTCVVVVLSDAVERKAVIAKLQDRIQLLCSRRNDKIITSAAASKLQPPGEPTPSHVETFILLQRELADNVACLFVFVEHPAVEPTNNRSERNTRREAEIRKGARTSKTDSGAKRRSIIVTVLASLQTRIARFTLSNMLAEVGRWVETGKSLFELELEAIQAKRAPPTQAEPA